MPYYRSVILNKKPVFKLCQYFEKIYFSTNLITVRAIKAILNLDIIKHEIEIKPIKQYLKEKEGKRLNIFYEKENLYKC